MRPGLGVRWAAVMGAVLMTAACTTATGIAGVSAQSPSDAPGTSTGTGTGTGVATDTASPAVTATIPVPTPTHQAAVRPPEGDDPVRVPPPKLSKYTYTFPVKGCEITYQRRLLVLPKTTIWAAKGCAFVAPVGGVVDEVNTRNRWLPSTDSGAHREGRFVTVVGDDGVRYLGGHLDSVADGIRPGVRVSAGQLLGRVGNTGNARDTGPNLYFAISWKTGSSFWWVRRGMVEPWDYLDAWLSGNRTLSPRQEALALRGRLGETPRCTVLCASKKVPKTRRTSEPEPEENPFTLDPTANPFGRP
ncbi:M23 family metallopeptidase [Nonomuraea sp. LPB2021202275-12-8]|uniref:M23 family metallopeptidase n=1 Tax=Nonomuraea sp. LPB2021202275-12-8 TaxID=3120159 RepID=UPI00300C8D31